MCIATTWQPQQKKNINGKMKSAHSHRGWTRVVFCSTCNESFFKDWNFAGKGGIYRHDIFPMGNPRTYNVMWCCKYKSLFAVFLVHSKPFVLFRILRNLHFLQLQMNVLGNRYFFLCSQHNTDSLRRHFSCDTIKICTTFSSLHHKKRNNLCHNVNSRHYSRSAVKRVSCSVTGVYIFRVLYRHSNLDVPH